MFSAPFKVFIQAAKEVWNDKASLILVNLVALAACVTVIFAPPAVFGLFYSAERLADGKKLGLTGLVEGGRKYFFQSWRWAILNLVVFFIVSVNLIFYEQMHSIWGYVLENFFIIILLVWLMAQFFALPYLIAMEEKKLMLALRNGWFTLMAFPGYSLVLMVLVIVVTSLSVVLIFPFLLITPYLLTYWATRAAQERLASLGIRR